MIRIKHNASDHCLAMKLGARNNQQNEVHNIWLKLLNECGATPIGHQIKNKKVDVLLDGGSVAEIWSIYLHSQFSDICKEYFGIDWKKQNLEVWEVDEESECCCNDLRSILTHDHVNDPREMEAEAWEIYESLNSS